MKKMLFTAAMLVAISFANMAFAAAPADALAQMQAAKAATTDTAYAASVQSQIDAYTTAQAEYATALAAGRTAASAVSYERLENHIQMYQRNPSLISGGPEWNVLAAAIRTILEKQAAMETVWNNYLAAVAAQEAKLAENAQDKATQTAAGNQGGTNTGNNVGQTNITENPGQNSSN